MTDELIKISETHLADNAVWRLVNVARWLGPVSLPAVGWSRVTAATGQGLFCGLPSSHGLALHLNLPRPGHGNGNGNGNGIGEWGMAAESYRATDTDTVACIFKLI